MEEKMNIDIVERFKQIEIQEEEIARWGHMYSTLYTVQLPNSVATRQHRIVCQVDNCSTIYTRSYPELTQTVRTRVLTNYEFYFTLELPIANYCIVQYVGLYERPT